MVYLAFDLDGTLGNFMILWLIICNLRQKDFFLQSPNIVIPDLPNDDFDWELGIAYTSFVKRIIDIENSKTPLGIFRPGVFKMFKLIAKLKEKKQISGVILYTNNGSKPLVEFIRDVIHLAVGSPVFDGVFHYYHPYRLKIGNKPNPTKTWTELKALLKAIGAPDSTPTHDVLFFDDQDHVPLIHALKTNYIKVEPYHYNPPIDVVLNIYENALHNSNLISDEHKNSFLNYVKGCTDKKAISVADHLELIKATPSTKFKKSGKGPIPPINSDFMILAIKKKQTQTRSLTRKAQHKKNTMWSFY